MRENRSDRPSAVVARQRDSGWARMTSGKRWFLFAIVTAIFFHITGSTFNSIGVVLPYMIADLSWSWTEAGTGFSLMALMVGLAGTVPAWTLRKFGVKATFGIGGVIMALGFSLLALTTGLYQYFVGIALLGVGYALCGTVPAVHMINYWMPSRRSFAIGAYMTIGGFGGILGPLFVISIISLTGSWRMHWWVMGASILFLALLAVLFVKIGSVNRLDSTTKSERDNATSSDKVHTTEISWRYRDVLRTPQYYVIVAAMAITLFCSITMNAWAVTHMGTLGISSTLAAGALSAQATVNALSRALGGALATHIDPKWLIVSALFAGFVGMLALAVADDIIAISLFALGQGYGFGMCLFATTVLLLNYFGPDENPEILGTLHLITTIGMIGPVLGGYIGDTFGGFSAVFQSYSVILLLILVAVALMRPPEHRGSEQAKSASAE